MTIEDAIKLVSGYNEILLRSLVAPYEQEIERLTARNQQLQAELEAAEAARTHTESKGHHNG